MTTKEPETDHAEAREFAEAVRHGTTGAANLARAYRDLETQLATSQAAHSTTIEWLADVEKAIIGLRKRLRERASESDKRLTRALRAEDRLAQAEKWLGFAAKNLDVVDATECKSPCEVCDGCKARRTRGSTP